MEKKLIVERVMALIHADFLTRKPPRKDDRKYFCVDCSSHALTEYEKEKLHKHHNVLKPFSCSRYYAYEVKDIKVLNMIDVSNVAVFSVNSKCVIFPKSRSLEHSSGGVGDACLQCGWKLGHKNGVLYCSILCKLLYDGWVPPESSDGQTLGSVVYGDGDDDMATMKELMEKILKEKRMGIRVPIFKGGCLKSKAKNSKSLNNKSKVKYRKN